MKKYVFLMLPFFINSCGYFNPVKLMKEDKMKNGTIIQLKYLGGGATAPSTIWVKKIPVTGNSYYVGMIDDFDDSYISSITELDSLHINVSLIDTIYFKNKKYDFIINLADTVYPSGPFLK
jgi:hypothetical protein